MSLAAAQTKPEYADVGAPAYNALMCLQPAELILQGFDDAHLRQKRMRVRWIVEELPPGLSIRGYCRLCLGSGSTARAVRAPSASRRGGDSHDDGSGGDDDGPPPHLGPPPAERRLPAGRAPQ